MSKKKLTIGVLYGGKSAEHEVSINSSKNVISALDKNKYKVIPIKLERKGAFPVEALKKVDIVFPVLHGPFGEDGTVQGLLKLFSVPFVGPSVLGSAICMDKVVTKNLLQQAGVSVGKFITFTKGEEISFKKIKAMLGMPVFVKPANLGSSVGINKVYNEKGWVKAIKDAFQYDFKIIVEENIVGREIECSVLGNQKPQVSLPGEIIPTKSFYSYESKYLDDNDAKLEIPAKLSKKEINKIQDTAIKSYRALNCEGMARVDFFLRKNGEVLVNEINTIPGFTNISMYPKLWEASGLPLSKLLDKLIDLALERFNREQKLKNTFK